MITICPSCTWRGDVELINGVCPQCDTDWEKLELREKVVSLQRELTRLQRIEQAAKNYIEHDDNMNLQRYDKLVAALEEIDK